MDFDYEIEKKMHPENFGTELTLEDLDQAENAYDVFAQLHEIQKIEAEFYKL